MRIAKTVAVAGLVAAMLSTGVARPAPPKLTATIYVTNGSSVTAMQPEATAMLRRLPSSAIAAIRSVRLRGTVLPATVGFVGLAGSQSTSAGKSTLRTARMVATGSLFFQPGAAATLRLLPPSRVLTPGWMIPSALRWTPREKFTSPIPRRNSLETREWSPVLPVSPPTPKAPMATQSRSPRSQE
jgi:hypothetical protein